MSSDKKTEESQVDGAESDGGAGKKKAKKKLIIIVAAVVVLLLAAGGGLFATGMLGGKKEEKTEEGEHKEEGAAGEHGKEETPAGEHGKEAKEGEPGKEGEDPNKKLYLNIGEFLVNLNVSGKQASFLKMTPTLEVMGAKNKLAVEENLPRIKDTFQVYLRELRADDLKGSAGVYRLREALLLRVNKVIYPAQVTDILFEEIIVQ